jgi:uncharacterized membrane protein
MTVTGPGSGQPAVSNTQVALIVYILYLVSYVTGGLTALVGVIIAHVQVDNADPMLASHYRFQIRTFWIGLFYIVVGFILAWVFIGLVVWLWWFIWSIIRIIKGLLLLNENRPIANPASWLFG